MYPQEGRTADSAAQIFKELCISRPSYWAENIIEATKNLKVSEQAKFWKWTTDPQNRTGTKDDKLEVVEADYSKLNLEGLEFVEETGGTVPMYTFIRRAKTSSDDEKISLE